MKIKFYYIHGLYGSKESLKFLELQKVYPNIECLDWLVDDDICLKLDLWRKKMLKDEEIFDKICVFASSTGANFACQLFDLMPDNKLQLVLINPLLDLGYVCKALVFPEILKPFLVPIHWCKNALILIGKRDEVVENLRFLEDFAIVNENNEVILDEESTHSFENLPSYYGLINEMLNG